jgi:hypothetical protein
MAMTSPPPPPPPLYLENTNPSSNMDKDIGVDMDIDMDMDERESGVTTASSHQVYCTAPLADSVMQQLLFNGLRNEYTTQFFHQMVQTVVVAGRRLGSMRPGKNRLIGELACLPFCLPFCLPALSCL